MERSERIGLGTAAAGHVLLFAALSLGFMSTRDAPPVRNKPLEVSLVPDVALAPSEPAATVAPSQRVSPDEGEPVDAAPPSPAPEPAPAPALAPQPEPKPAPRPAERPQPAPKPVAKPAPERPKPVAKPRPAPKPAPKPAPVRAKPQPKPAAKPAPSKAAPAKAAPTKSASAKSTSKAPAKSSSAPAKSTAKASSKPSNSASRGNGASKSATATRARGGRLGDNFLAGLSAEKSDAKPNAAPPSAARVDAKALAGIVQAIARQIQPCADRQVDPGPGANQITTVLNLRLNRDGSLSATPRVVRQTGIDDDNKRYAGRVVELGIAAFKACAPLRLPAEYYSTANGGWSNINYNWKLR